MMAEARFPTDTFRAMLPPHFLALEFQSVSLKAKMVDRENTVKFLLKHDPESGGCYCICCLAKSNGKRNIRVIHNLSGHGGLIATFTACCGMAEKVIVPYRFVIADLIHQRFTFLKHNFDIERCYIH